MGKDSFILYKNHYPAFKGLSFEEKGILLDAIFTYQIEGIEPEDLPPVVMMAFNFIKVQFDFDGKKYDEKCDRNKENANKRWNIQTDTTACDCIRTDANHADNDNDNDNYIKRGKKSIAFIPPSLPDIQKFIIENHYNVDANSFLNFYESKNWMIGKNKMKNWQAAIRTWEMKNKKTNQNEKKYIY